MALPADDSGAGILHSTGSVLLNRNAAPPTSAVFAGDLIEVQNNAVARIEVAGSAADISPETVVQFENGELLLEHGGLSVNTSRGLKVRTGCTTVKPVHLAWTQYEVSDVDGRVSVSALKDDVYLESSSSVAQEAKQSARSERAIVRAGERKSREEKCGGAMSQGSGPRAATVGIMNSPYVMWSAVGVIAGACWALCRHDDPISPDHP